MISAKSQYLPNDNILNPIRIIPYHRQHPKKSPLRIHTARRLMFRIIHELVPVGDHAGAEDGPDSGVNDIRGQRGTIEAGDA